MRNLKKLLAVVVSICVLATFTVPAFAADTAATTATKTAASICADLGVLRGDSADGVSATYLAQGTTRMQAAILYLRLIGKEAAAYAETSTANFADADLVKWADGKAALAYLKANPDLGWQGDAGKFDPNGVASAQMLYKVVLEALGYKQGTDFQWADTLTFAASKGLKDAAAVTALTNNDAATILVEALKANLKDGSKTLAADLVAKNIISEAAATAAGLYNPAVTATVAATGAKKLTVTFNQAIDTTKAVFVAKRGTVTPSVKTITFAEDKKSAVIEFSVNMTAGDYTVTVSGLTDKALTATVTVVASKLTAIKFLSDIAVISGNNVTTTVVAENQYGEDITSTIAGSNVTTSKGTSASVNDDGLVTVVGTSGLFSVDDTFVVTVVDADTGVSATKTLKVAKSAAVESIVFGALATDDEDLKDEAINVTAMTTNATDYYMPITVKDQYGNTLKAADLGSSVFSLISSNTKIVKLATTPIVDTDDYGTVIKFQTADATATNGTVILTAVATSTGKTANTTIVVKEDSEIDVVTLSAPATELKETIETALPVTVLDSYGAEVALSDITLVINGAKNEITLDADTKITAVNATFSTSTDYVKDVTTIKITPTATNVILTVTTSTGKYQSLSLSANDAPEVTAIKGVDSDFVAYLANDTSLDTQLDDKVIFLDQYGDEIDAPTFDAANSTAALDFTIAPDDSTNTVTEYSAGLITASTTAGAETYVITLKNADGDTLDSTTVTVNVVDIDDITAFGVEDLNKFYTDGTASSDYDQQVEIYGLVNGKEVVVNQNMIQNVSASNGLIIGNHGAYTPATVAVDEDTKSTITVLVANNDNSYVVTKDVLYNDAAAKAATLYVQLDDADVTGAIQVTPANAENIVTGLADEDVRIFAKDQYGVELTTGYSFVVTNNTTTATVSIGTNGAITLTGTPTVGKSFMLYTFIDGLSASIKIVIG